MSRTATIGFVPRQEGLFRPEAWSDNLHRSPRGSLVFQSTICLLPRTDLVKMSWKTSCALVSSTD